MAISDVRVTVTLERASGLPEDQIVNTWSFRMDPAVNGDVVRIRDAVAGFYNDTQPGSTEAVGEFLANSIVRGAAAARMRMYRLIQAAPDELFYDESMLLTPPAVGVDDLPEEVALCTSFHADLSGTNQPDRRRGRVFIGPLNSAALAGGTGPARPDAGFIATLAEATNVLASEAQEPGPGPYSQGLGVFSRVDHTVRLVVGGWVDNAFDTQRRRGVDASARTTW